MASETERSHHEVAFAGAIPHGVSRGYVLAFPCSYDVCNTESQHKVPRHELSATSAAHVCAAFRRIGFNAVMHRNFGAASIVGAVDGAAQALLSSDVLVLYFSGHGCAHMTRQYLIAEDGKYVDADSLRAVVSQAVGSNGVSNVTLLALLDCCRRKKRTAQQSKQQQRAGDTPGPLAEERVYCLGADPAVEATARSRQAAVHSGWQSFGTGEVAGEHGLWSKEDALCAVADAFGLSFLTVFPSCDGRCSVVCYVCECGCVAVAACSVCGCLCVAVYHP